MKADTRYNEAFSYALMGFLIGTGLFVIILFLGLVFLDRPISFEMLVELFRETPALWVTLTLPFVIGGFGYYIGNEFFRKTNDLRKDIRNEQQKSRQIFDFVEKIRLGQTDAQYEIREGDEIGKALINLRDELKRSKAEEDARKNEDEQRHWITEGIAKFGAILRENIGDLEKLSNEVIMNLVKYVNAQQAGFFILVDNNGEKYFNMTASYAYGRTKYPDKKIEWGEGLVGECAIEKKTIFVPEAARDYVKITSGLGKANPRTLVIVPLKFNDEIYGVVETASFIVYQPFEIEFIERVAESIASTISNVNINLRTARSSKSRKNKPK